MEDQKEEQKEEKKEEKKEEQKNPETPPQDEQPQQESCDYCGNNLSNLDSFSCSHKICPICLYRRFFIKNITDLEGLCDTIVIKCGKCENGSINKNLDELIRLSSNKNNADNELKEIKENNQTTKGSCPSHQLLNDFFCLDCYEYLCQKCKNSENNPHYNHSIMPTKKIIKNLKAEINNIPFKFKAKSLFEQNWNLLSKKFKENTMEIFNETLEQINELSKAVEELKKEYETKYKAELTKFVKTLKILNIYYSDYYKEKDEALNNKDDIESLRYVNSIRDELVNMELSKEVYFSQKLNDAKNLLDNLRTSSNKFNFNVKLIYEKIKMNYNFDSELNSAHDKYITSLILLKDDKIFTTSRDFSMKIWEEKEDNNFIMDKKIEKGVGNIICAIKVDNNKILTSSAGDNSIYMWGFNSKGELNKEQSFSSHNDLVLTMIQLNNNTLISGGKDNAVIIWTKNEDGFFEEKQKINDEKPILKLIGLKNDKFGYTSDNGILNIMGIKGEEKNYEKICEINHEGKIMALCEAKNGILFTGGTGLQGKKNYNIYLWSFDQEKGEYNRIQILGGHKADVNNIIELKDGRIVSSSRDRTLFIWKENKVENNIKYVKSEQLTEYPHGMFLLAQLQDGRICTSTSNNSLIFWRNWGSLPYC